MIGVLIGDVSFEFSSVLMSGISDAAMAANVQVLYFLGMQKHAGKMAKAGVGDGSINHNSVYDYAGLSGADAFIIACGSLSGFSGGGLDARFMQRFAGKPYVVLQERIEPVTPMQTYVVIDNYTSYSQCIEHLIVTHGYRRIGFVSGPRGHYDARARLSAYLDTMARHNLPVDDSMIVYGDFYEYVDTLVAELIDGCPGLEAIAFANDEMAKAGYRECARRGLVVGRDIAMTGFDNLSFCHTMDPPLTTVSQEAYRMGRLAVEKALKMVEGKQVRPVEMKTEFVPRQSCGCSRGSICFTPTDAVADQEAFVDHVFQCIEESYSSQFSHDEQEACLRSLRACLREVRPLVLASQDAQPEPEPLLRVCAAFAARSRQPLAALGQSLEDVIKRLLCSGYHSPLVGRLTSALFYMQQHLARLEKQALSAASSALQLQSWIAPELTRGLYGQDSDEEVFRSVAERLAAAGFINVYICLLEEPQYFDNTGLASIPQRLLLAAYRNRQETKVYSRGTMPVIDSAHPFGVMPGFKDAGSMMGFSFFSGENQYGMLLCEAEVNKSALLHVIGLQLGMLLDFLALRRKEMAIAEELEDIREKNEILNFLSEYDLMCGLLNRRGFIERAIRLNRENIGKTAYCAFIDLDYLKQINDTYGHPEGDIALQTVSAVLQRCVTEYDLIGRIGGDEFVGMFITEEEGFQEHLVQCLKRESERYNQTSGKPYLVDISVGVARFTCQQGLEVSSIIAEADKYLYEAKRSRVTHALRMRTGDAHQTKMAKPGQPPHGAR